MYYTIHAAVFNLKKEENYLSNMQYSIVIANYNGKHLLDTCLSALLPQVDHPSHIIVVDNGSTDGSADHMNKEWPCVTSLPLKTNTGFTGANNSGAALSTSEIIVLLNNDTKVTPDWLNNLLSPFDNPSVGAVTSSMRRMGDISIMDSAGGALDYLGYSFDRGRGEPESQWRESDEVLFPCGGAMAVRRSALEESNLIFWNHLFLYNEDSDLGLRLWKNGYRVIYQPNAVVEHALSATAGETSPIRVRYCTRNRILVMKRHLGDEFKKVSSILSSWEIMSLGFMLSQGQIGRFRASLSGFKEAFNTKVIPYGNTKGTVELFSRFMQPTGGTTVRKKMGLSLYKRISSSDF